MSLQDTLVSVDESTTVPTISINEDDAELDRGNEENAPYQKKKRKKFSSVCHDFKELTLTNGDVKAQCIHCKQQLKMNKSGSTSHLKTHYEICIPRKANQTTKGQQTLTVTNTVSQLESVASVQNFKYDQAKVREVLSHMLIVHELPISFSEYELFNLLMRTVTPHYEKIIRAIARNDCMTSFELEKKKMMLELKGLSSKKLVLDCCTRWNATYYMLSAALEFKDVFPRYQQRDASYTSLPSEEEWRKVQVICKFLGEFEELTELISGSEYPTANLFLPELVLVKNLLKEKSQETFMQEMLTLMNLRFEKYWGSNNLFLCLAAVLDPRKECSTSVSTGSQSKSRALLESYMSDDEFVIDNSELDLYLEEPVVKWKEPILFDAIAWWKMNNSKYGILSRMTCDVLSVPITTVASESAFGAGGRVIDPHRASLGVNTVQMLLCAGDWLRARYGIKAKARDKYSIKEITLT
ncbi:hypothetical protein C2S52_011948 [Perilla frutescens var. hirtella]|nr:hypothetical protein C2S52_011948 [Perilla frutescens var. hirtella]